MGPCAACRLGDGLDLEAVILPVSTGFDERDGGTFFGFSDPDGNTWAVQQLKVRADKPLIPHEARGRFSG